MFLSLFKMPLLVRFAFLWGGREQRVHRNSPLTDLEHTRTYSSASNQCCVSFNMQHVQVDSTTGTPQKTLRPVMREFLNRLLRLDYVYGTFAGIIVAPASRTAFHALVTLSRNPVVGVDASMSCSLSLSASMAVA